MNEEEARLAGSSLGLFLDPLGRPRGLPVLFVRLDAVTEEFGTTSVDSLVDSAGVIDGPEMLLWSSPETFINLGVIEGAAAIEIWHFLTWGSSLLELWFLEAYGRGISKRGLFATDSGGAFEHSTSFERCVPSVSLGLIARGTKAVRLRCKSASTILFVLPFGLPRGLPVEGFDGLLVALFSAKFGGKISEIHAMRRSPELFFEPLSEDSPSGDGSRRVTPPKRVRALQSVSTTVLGCSFRKSSRSRYCSALTSSG